MDFNEYDEGFRLGTFDKCNGRDTPRVEEDGSIYSTGYYDAWASNNNQMAVDEEAEAERLTLVAEDAGIAYANEIRPTLQEKGRLHGDFADAFFDAFYDNC